MKVKVAVAVLVAGCGGSPSEEKKPPVAKTTLGEPVTVLESGALGLSYFPDMATIELGRQPEWRLLVTAVNATYLVEGADLFELTSATPVLLPGASGEFDSGYAGVSGAYRDPTSGRIYAFYHAEDHEGLPVLPESGIPGFYASIGLAVSDDDGATFEKLGAVVTSNKPKEWAAYPEQGDRGAAEPGVLLDEQGRFLYLYYDEHSRVDDRGVQVCVARADLDAGPPLPGAFVKYFEGDFTEPGIGGRDTPVISAKHRDDAEAMFPHPVYSRHLDAYVMILNLDFWKEWQAGLPAAQSGFYVSFSTDAVAWTEPDQLFADDVIPLSGRSFSWEGNILWDDDEGKSGWMVYGRSPGWPTPHNMVARRISFE